MTTATCAGQLPLFTEITGLLEDREPSDGLTLDTAAGPVDLVAIERALSGAHIDLTHAERAYLDALTVGRPMIPGRRVPLASATTVVNMHGRSEDPGYGDVVYVGRAVRWGGWNLPTSPLANPYRIGRDGDGAEVIARYKQHLYSRPDLMALARSLRGRRLGCWCAPDPCHADVIAVVADTEPEGH